MPLTVAVLKETAQGEQRIALDPVAAKKLLEKDIQVVIEDGAGEPAGFPNHQYSDQVQFSQRQEVLAQADCLLWVQPPPADDLAALGKDSTVIGLMLPHTNTDLLHQLNQQQLSALAMELIPRITRAQSMDVLSSQATVAGYKATLRAATLAPRLFPMLTTAAGTLRPASVIVIGAGVAGLQAIATARRLGARVEAYDIRPAAREQVESLGAKMIDTGINAEGEGGYARELTAEEKQQQADKLAEHLAKADTIISTAAIPGRPAPKIITAAMVDGMQAGSVIVDLAAETGGNCALTEPGNTVNHHGVIIDGPLNLASAAATHASEMYARNVFNLLELMIADGQLTIDPDDEVIAGCLLTQSGQVVHPQHTQTESD